MSLEIPEINGLFLSGGMSQRMGLDKALLDYAGVSELCRWKAVLDDLGLPFYWSQRPGQYPPAMLPEIERVLDQVPGQGPMAALLSAFERDPCRGWLVLACDWPLLGAEDLVSLLQAREPEAWATAFITEGRFEPLCTLYEPKFYLPAKSAFEQGQRSLSRLLLDLRVKPVTPRASSLFLNANDPTSRAQAKQKIADQAGSFS